MEPETVRRPALTDSCRWSACVAGRTEHRTGHGRTEIPCERSQALCPTRLGMADGNSRNP
jgi:hypothetical protein